MCLKYLNFTILFLFLLSHAYTTVIFAHKESQLYKIEEKLKFKKFSPNRRLAFASAEDLCKQNEAIKRESTEDCRSFLHKALQHVRKSKRSRWTQLNVREMDRSTTIFREDDLSETDYQPPHRKSPIHNK